MSERTEQLESKIARNEISEVLGTSIGSLSFGAAATVAFGEVVTSQPEHVYTVSGLAALSLLSFAQATRASRRISQMQAEINANRALIDQPAR